MKTLETRCWKGRQSVTLRTITVVGRELRVKTEVCRDSYDEQSYARAWVWSGASLSWNPICDIPSAENTAVRNGISHAGNVEKVQAHLSKDEAELLKLAKAILNL